jgi:hypothetical protein
MYIENLCHRDCWFRLFIVFDPTHCTSTAVLHNLLFEEREYINERLGDKTLQPLSLHPMFVPTLIIELLFREALQLLDSTFVDSVKLYIVADLIADDRYKNDQLRINQHLDAERRSEDSLKYEQQTLVLLEKMESAIKLASKLMSWLPEFETDHMSSDLQSRFRSAGDIIQNRLEYLIDTLDLQMLRAKRTQGHAELDRLGVSVLTPSSYALPRTPVVDDS